MSTPFLIRGVLFLLLLVAAALQLRFAVEEQLVFSDNTELLVDERIRNPYVLTHFAKEQHLFAADLDQAARLLTRALTCSPLYVPAWLSLAELYNDRGEKAHALATMDYADRLTRSIKRWRWEKTLTAYQLGLRDLLPGELRYIIAEIPGKNRTSALQLAFRLWPDPEELLARVGPENLAHLFAYAVRNNLANEAQVFWRHFGDPPAGPDEREVLAYIDMLMRTDHVAVAAAVWRRQFHDREAIYNPAFTSRPLNRAFGWRIGNHKDFDQRFEPLPVPGSHALHLRFKGWDNLNFHHLQQIVPLTPGARYRFTVQQKTAKITTDQRPFWEVYGYKCQMERAAAPMVAIDQDWAETALEFTVPDECSAVVLRLRRTESRMLDNKIAGQLWIREPQLTAIEEPRDLPDEWRDDR